MFGPDQVKKRCVLRPGNRLPVRERKTAIRGRVPEVRQRSGNRNGIGAVEKAGQNELARGVVIGRHVRRAGNQNARDQVNAGGAAKRPCPETVNVQGHARGVGNVGRECNHIPVQMGERVKALIGRKRVGPRRTARDRGAGNVVAKL